MRATEFTTGISRLSFVHLNQPHAQMPGSEEKYSVTVIIPKTDTETKARLDNAFNEAKKLGISSKWGGKTPAVIGNPVYDGDGVRPNGEPFGDECKGCWVVTASSKADRKPDVVDLNLNSILDPAAIYSGMYGRVCINFFPYEFGGKRGIGAGLGPVQKVKDGEPLGGGVTTAKDAFGAFGTPQVDPITGEIIQ